MKKFVCKVCGYIYEGEAAPAECPVCHAKSNMFEEVKGELTLAAEHQALQQDYNWQMQKLDEDAAGPSACTARPDSRPSRRTGAKFLQSSRRCLPDSRAAAQP